MTTQLKQFTFADLKLAMAERNHWEGQYADAKREVDRLKQLLSSAERQASEHEARLAKEEKKVLEMAEEIKKNGPQV